MSAGKAAGMGKSKKRFTDQRPGGSTRKPTAAYFLAEVPVPVDKGLPGSTSKVEYPSLQAASKQLPTNSQGAAQDALEEPKSTGDAVTQTVAAIAALVDKKVDAMRPQREQLKRCIEACLEACLSGDVLEGSIVEVVGSTAWGGEVPQSDLDLVLVTPSSSSTPSQALVLLQALVAKLESQSKAERHWSRLELVEARKVPVLRLHDRAGLSCDVVVDQLHALDHRKLLAEALEGRPEVKSFIRLVKYWLRQRGLPVGSEGGLPSFAWAYTALQFAMQRPKNASVQDLLFHFFKQMNLLSSMSLLLQQKENGVTVAWKSRKDPAPWSQEWIELLVVDDPTRKHPSGVLPAAELDDDEEKLESLRAELAERQALEARGEAPGAMVSKVSITDSVEVPVQVIGAVIGSGGAVIKQLAAESGARMSFAQEDYQPGYLALTRRCLISGATDVVEKAKALLQEVVSSAMADQDRGGRKGKGKGQRKGTPTNLSSDLVGEGAGGRAGFQVGICKWYAAGFCRNRPDASGGCRNGLHSTDAALKAEADWVAQGPSGVVQPSRPLLLLLDLEGGGNKDGRDGEDEIIEVPILSMCSSTGKECGRFHRFARPGYWTREEWSMRNRFHAGCFNNGASSVPFPEVVFAIQNWLRDLLKLAPGEELRSEDFLFVTCGNWDVKSAIPRQCSNPVPGTVDYSLQQLLFSRWSNLKEVYRDFYKLPDSAAPTGMRGMLKLMRIPLSGQHHLGMDDVSNLAKILQRLIHEGCKVEPTGHKAPVGLPMKGKKGKGKGKDKGKDKGKGKEGKDRGKDKGKDEGYGVNGSDMHGHGPGNGWGKAEGGKGEDVRAERSEEGKKGEAEKAEEGEGKGEEGKQNKMREDEEGDGGEELEEDAGPPLKAPRILNPPVMLPAPTGSLAEPPRRRLSFSANAGTGGTCKPRQDRPSHAARADRVPGSPEDLQLARDPAGADRASAESSKEAGYQSMTPPTIPSALGALYLAEVRLALAAMKEAKWDELWRPASSEVKTLLPAALKGKAQLHIVLKDGELTVGRLDKVLRCPNVQNEELHRRDQSSELQLRACSLSKDPKSDSTKLSLTEESLCCKPCNWVCALPTWNMAAKAGDAQTRLNELVAMVQSWKCKSNPPVPAAADGRMYVPVMAPIIVGGQCGLQQGVFMPVYRVASFYPGVQQPAPDQGSRQVSSVVVLNDLFKAWTGAPRAVGLQKAVQAPRIQGKARQPASSQDKKPAERTQEASEAQEVCPSEKGSGAAGSDDSTRASDSEEFFPVRKQKGKKAPRKARDCRPTQSEKAPDQPFATALALNLDAPSRRESWPFLTDKPKIQSRS
ncbi:unnamed protein product [Effrenium voratum]|nr:unnamed protein product [Effrenium voratum]